MQVIRNELISKFEMESRTAKTLHTKEINKSLETRRKELNVELEKEVKLKWDMHNKDLYSIKQKLFEEMEQVITKHAQGVSNIQTKQVESQKFIEKQCY
jgi:hypothetical protein